jgi:hypothetical protein
MALQISISNAIGARAVAGGGGIDPDAQAFITAAAITDPTQQTAINQLVIDLKGYSIWSKMKALYPFVGGTSTSTSYNLKNTAQFQISWIGGVTSSANGVQFGGVNGYGDTGLNENSVMTLNNEHISVYSRTNSDGLFCDIGVTQISPASETNIFAKYLNGFYPRVHDANAGVSNTISSLGLFISNRVASNQIRAFQNNVLKTISSTSSGLKVNRNFFIGAVSSAAGNATLYSNRQLAFSSIGDGLTDTEAANFYTAVQAFQTTLGRSIGTQTVSDADAQAFVTNAGIVDQVEANAINNLVIGLKADSLWTKMKAVYPFVGGTASAHSYNLKNTAQYQINWSGGITHNSNGVTFGGVNGYGNTNLNMLTVFSSAYSSYGAYIRNTLTGTNISGTNTGGAGGPRNDFGYDTGVTVPFFANGTLSSNLGTDTDSKGMLIGTRQSATVVKLFRNNVAKINTTNTFSSNDNGAYYIGARNSPSGTQYFSNNAQMALHYISDGLDDTEATNLNSRVTTFQTALNRNI